MNEQPATTEQRLWHYTCKHAAKLISRDMTIKANANPIIPILWMTDLEIPDRNGLGLTMKTLKCDRTAYRFEVVGVTDIYRWVDVRRSWRGTTAWAWVEAIESTEGAMPMHWYVSKVDQPVIAA